VSDRTLPKQIEEQLGEELLRIHRESYGKGAGRAVITIDDDVVYCMLDDLELLPNEEFLIDSGREDAVDIRLRYQQAIETSFRAAVERATGRRVISFASVTKLSPNYVVEIFRLGPEKESQLREPSDG
jgi:uncharacterized protein YbcI